MTYEKSRRPSEDRVVDSTGVDRARRRSGGRLENDALLKTPEQEQESEISEPKADQEPRDAIESLEIASTEQGFQW